MIGRKRKHFNTVFSHNNAICDQKHVLNEKIPIARIKEDETNEKDNNEKIIMPDNRISDSGLIFNDQIENFCDKYQDCPNIIICKDPPFFPSKKGLSNRELSLVKSFGLIYTEVSQDQPVFNNGEPETDIEWIKIEPPSFLYQPIPVTNLNEKEFPELPNNLSNSYHETGGTYLMSNFRFETMFHPEGEAKKIIESIKQTKKRETVPWIPDPLLKRLFYTPIRSMSSAKDIRNRNNRKIDID